MEKVLKCYYKLTNVKVVQDKLNYVASSILHPLTAAELNL